MHFGHDLVQSEIQQFQRMADLMSPLPGAPGRHKQSCCLALQEGLLRELLQSNYPQYAATSATLQALAS